MTRSSTPLRNSRSRVAYVRETGSGNDPKSDAGTRAVPLSAVVVKDLKAWRKAQTAERLAWGPDWPDTGRVFAAGASSKEISQQLGHSRQSFTDTTYVTVFPDVARAAAEAAAALVPRKRLRPKEVPHVRCACTVRAEHLRARKQGPPEDDFPGKPLVKCGGSGI
jgi:hypothetical protein